MKNIPFLVPLIGDYRNEAAASASAAADLQAFLVGSRLLLNHGSNTMQCYSY